MKKIIATIATLLALSMAFVGCNKEGGDDTVPNSEPSTPAAPAEKVVFDPATYTGDVGEVVDVEGVKYLKVTVDAYNTTIAVTEVDLSGCTEFSGAAYAAEANANFNLTLKLADSSQADISSIPFYGVKTEVSTQKAGKAEKQSWNTVSETMKCTVVQPMVQDSTDGYAAQSGVVVYIGKIIAK